MNSIVDSIGSSLVDSEIKGTVSEEYENKRQVASISNSIKSKLNLQFKNLQFGGSSVSWNMEDPQPKQKEEAKFNIKQRNTVYKTSNTFILMNL